MTVRALRIPASAARTRTVGAILVILLVIGAVGLALSTVYWLVDLDWVLRDVGGPGGWAMAGGAEGGAAEVGWPALHRRLQELVPERLLAALTAASKDASTITPLIAMMFFFHLALGSGRGLLSRERIAGAGWHARTSYPFPAGFERTWVQLGLIGTLWSFMVLGGSLRSGLDPDTTIEILVIAFSTALLSTLTGVVAAYVVAPGVIALFRRLLPQELATQEEDASELLQGVEKALRGLVASSRKVSVSLAGRGRESAEASLHERLEDAGRAVGEFTSTLREPQLAERLGALASGVAEQIESGLSQRLARLEDRSGANLLAFARSLGEGLGELARAIEKGQTGHADRLVEGLNQWQTEREQKAAEQRARQEEDLKGLREELAEGRRHLDRIEARLKTHRRDLDEVAGRVARELRAHVAELTRRNERWASGRHRFQPPRRAAVERMTAWLGRLLGGQ